MHGLIRCLNNMNVSAMWMPGLCVLRKPHPSDWNASILERLGTPEPHRAPDPDEFLSRFGALATSDPMAKTCVCVPYAMLGPYPMHRAHRCLDHIKHSTIWMPELCVMHEFVRCADHGPYVMPNLCPTPDTHECLKCRYAWAICADRAPQACAVPEPHPMRKIYGRRSHI